MKAGSMAGGAQIRKNSLGLDMVEVGDDKDDLNASDEENKAKTAVKVDMMPNSRRDTMITNSATNKTGVAATQPSKKSTTGKSSKSRPGSAKKRPSSSKKTTASKPSSKEKQGTKQPTQASSLSASYKRQESPN